MVRVKLMCILLFACVIVMQPHPSSVLGQGTVRQQMRCDPDPYDPLPKECVVTIFPGNRSDEDAARIECRHGSDVETFPCRYSSTSSGLEYSCTSSSGETTLFRPRDIGTNPQRVCNALCRGCVSQKKKR